MAPVLGPESGPSFRPTTTSWHQKRGAPGGPKTGAIFAAVFAFSWAPEAMAAWRWANFWEGLCPPSKRIVFVNIDETSVPLRESGARGYVHIPPGMHRGHVLAAEEPVALAARRTYMSLVAMLSDDTRAQKLLPQVLVTNERTLGKEAHVQLQAYLRESTSLFVWRRRSAWVDGAAMVRLLALLKETLRPLSSEVQVVLLLDCSPVHASKRVVAAAARFGFRLVMIPSSMTGVLQPLDVYCFADLKRRLREAVSAHRAQDPHGALPPVTVCRILMDAVESCISRGDWVTAFRGCGFGGGQRGLGGRAKRKMEWPSGAPFLGSDLPSLQDLQRVWMRGKTVPIVLLFRLALPPPADAEPVAEQPTRRGGHEWTGRLRSSSAQSLAIGEVEQSESNVGVRHPAAAWTRPRIPRGVRLWMGPSRTTGARGG